MLQEDNAQNVSTNDNLGVNPLSNLAQGETKGVSTNPFRALGDFNKTNADELLGVITDISKNYQILIESSQQLANSMGIGQARSKELKLTIADTVPELTKLGLTTEQSFKALKDAPVALGTNTTIAKETIIELGATTKFTGLEVGALAKTFKDVGFELGKVGETMADVANYAKSVGANVLEVTKLVSGQLKNLNLFNFENGVQGLSKMAASATMLGYDMTKVIAQAEKLLKPENAIEFSAALQRLGVTSTELLDPLSAMDLAMNNPERLATEMEKVAQQFVQLKADGSGFEIMPGAKLQLREVASELGYTAEEFASMAVRGADLDMKLKQIRFPAFAASEEDRMLIANMAQMKDGRAVVQIEQDDKLEEVAVEDLTAEQLKELQAEQANQNKTEQELAIDQLNVLQQIAANTSGGLQAAQLGTATTGPITRYLETINQTRLAITQNTLGKVETEDVRDMAQSIVGPLEEALVEFVKNPSIDNLTGMLPKFNDSLNGIKETGETLIKATGQSFTDMANQWTKAITKIYGENNVSKTAGVEFYTDMQEKIKEQEGSQINDIANKTTTNNVNVTQSVDVTFKSDGSVDMNMLEKYLQKDEFPVLFSQGIQDLNKDVKASNAVVDIVNNPSSM